MTTDVGPGASARFKTHFRRLVAAGFMPALRSPAIPAIHVSTAVERGHKARGYERSSCGPSLQWESGPTGWREGAKRPDVDTVVAVLPVHIAFDLHTVALEIGRFHSWNCKVEAG